MTKATLLGIRAAAAAVLLAAAATSAMAWERPHADSANTNFADVRTFRRPKTPVKGHRPWHLRGRSGASRRA